MMRGLILAALAMLLGVPAAAQEAPAAFVSTHETRIGPRFAYKAVAGETWVRGYDGSPHASVFSVSYLRQGVRTAERPVIFAFNGGPGSASYWLTMGLLGPRRVALPADARGVGGGPVRLVDNVHSPLDVADVVMIDPVGTGFSRAINGHKDEEFWGIAEDAGLLADFVREWLTANGRWGSPKYILGESYGGTRAAAMTRALAQEERGQVALRGLILIAPVTDFQMLRTAAQYPLTSAGFLPSYAATAWYHRKVPSEPELEPFLEQARAFATDEYLPALVRGSRLPAADRARVLERLAHFTGLSPQWLDGQDLHVDPFRFMKELLRDRRLTVGRMDARYTGEDFDTGGERPDYDASQAGYGPAFSAAIMQHLGEELGVRMDRPYLALNRSGVKPLWNWNQPDVLRWSGGMNPEWPVHVNVAPWIGDEMRRNGDFRVLLAVGYYDLAVPFFAAENSMYQAGMVPERTTFSYFPTGHMIYVEPASLAKLAGQIRGFVTAPER